MNNLPVAKEAWPYLLGSLAAALLLSWINPWLGIIPAVFFFFCLFFFRNPSRRISPDPLAALSPADGRVMRVTRVREPRLQDDEVWKVDIFLSIFNVHFNRAPLAGTVTAVDYVPGQFLPAFKSHASTLNERNYVLFQTGRGMVMVAQITGFIARRIVCWIKPGDSCRQGDRFGLIKFGSCTEIYLPLNYTVCVQIGDRVKGGVTVIGRIKESC